VSRTYSSRAETVESGLSVTIVKWWCVQVRPSVQITVDNKIHMAHNRPMNGMQRAVEKVGTQLALARLIGRYPQEISRWVKAGRAPARHCRAIERATGVPCTELRPEKITKAA
jgi:hypothetical protein